MNTKKVGDVGNNYTREEIIIIIMMISQIASAHYYYNTQLHIIYL